jgi:glycosyltransferase involved in cell wall biosynthesis
MNICFYAPFKHLMHSAPSGDQTIGKGLYRHLESRGHRIWTVGTLRCRWIYWKPWRLFQVPLERLRAVRKVQRIRPDLWLTYHTYYKAPDIIGPAVCRRLGLPYAIFQGVYATKRRRRVKTWPGFVLNTRALRSAVHVFTNKRKDLHNLKRIIPAHRLTYVTPGIPPGDFTFLPSARESLRHAWQIDDAPVILTAAMFRADVKTEGLAMVIRACGRLLQMGRRFNLVIAGDGKMKSRLVALAGKQVPGRTRFIGKLPRDRMAAFYSAGDMFAFPGIRESLGMVFLEAQSCGMPVIAYANEGTPEVIRHLDTGILVPAFDFDLFVTGMDALIQSPNLRRKMGQAASAFVRKEHDIDRNYGIIEQTLRGIAHAP